VRTPEDGLARVRVGYALWVPLPRFEKLAPEKRRLILDVAREEIAEHGYNEASLNRIIARCGISKGAMYYYFADKADVFFAVLDDVADRVEAKVESSVPRPTSVEGFWSSVEAAFGAIVELALEDPELVALGRMLYAGGPQASLDRLGTRLTSWVAAALGVGRELGAVRSDVAEDVLVAATTGMLLGVDRLMVDLAPEEGEIAIRAVIDLTRSMLAPSE